MAKQITKHTVGVTINGQKQTININVDWSGIEHAQILNWASRSRIIDFQRVLRSKTPEFVASLNGKTFHASEMGNNVKTRDDKIADLVRAGIPEPVATLIVDNPEQAAKLLDK